MPGFGVFHVYVCMYVYVCVCVCLCVWIYVCVCACVYVWLFYKGVRYFFRILRHHFVILAHLGSSWIHDASKTLQYGPKMPPRRPWIAHITLQNVSKKVQEYMVQETRSKVQGT